MNYLIIANTYLFLFYIFYYLLLSKETFFQWNRIYLVGSTGLSFLLPIIHLDWLQDLFKTSTVMIARTNLDTVTIYGNPAQAEVTESGILNLPVWIYFYATGCLVSTILLIRRAILLKKQLRVNEAGEAYSFMHIIHVDKAQEGSDAILNHEQVHANQYHTLDVLFFELVKVFNWFNPVVYYLSKSAKLTHEYIADEAVNKSNDEKIAYAELLISRTFSISSKLLANNFLDHSFVKSRVKMLFKDKSRRTASLKYLLIVPLFFCMLIFSSAKVSEVKELGALSFNAEGNSAFYKLVGKNVMYMKAAKEKNMQGAVDIAFEKQGNDLIKTKVLNTIGYKQEEEVERVLHLSEVKDEMPEGKHILRIKFVMMDPEKGKSFEGKTTALAELSGYKNLEDIVIVGYMPNKDSKKERDVISSVQIMTQQDTVMDKKIESFNDVEVQPAFPGGMRAFYTWIGKNYKYSQDAKKNQVNGTIAVSFIVERDGALSSFKILRDLGYGTGEEAINLLKKSPKWKPGLIKGEPVRVSYSLPIRLNLVGIKDTTETKATP